MLQLVGHSCITQPGIAYALGVGSRFMSQVYTDISQRHSGKKHLLWQRELQSSWLEMWIQENLLMATFIPLQGCSRLQRIVPLSTIDIEHISDIEPS